LKKSDESKQESLKNEEIKAAYNNNILKELDNRHKLKLTNLAHQDYLNKQIDNKKDDKFINEYISSRMLSADSI
jgi:hypothetical protein